MARRRRGRCSGDEEDKMMEVVVEMKGTSAAAEGTDAAMSGFGLESQLAERAAPAASRGPAHSQACHGDRAH